MQDQPSGIGIGAMLFGQISHLLGYSSIYKSAALSVLISIILYFVFASKDKKARVIQPTA